MIFLRKLFFLVNFNVLCFYGLIVMNYIMIGCVIIAKVSREQLQYYKQLSIQHQTVLFVTAHPDDESMFFLPTISKMKSQHHSLFLLCFSNGDFDGLGKIREKELLNAAEYLGFSRLEIINEDSIQDGMSNIWPIEKMSEIINKYVQNYNISMIITFDEKGISGHPNHIDVHKSVKMFKKNNLDNTIKCFQLESVNIFRKYIGLFDITFSILSQHKLINLNPILPWKAMAIHNSQFVYYRKAFVLFSRYAYINTLETIK